MTKSEIINRSGGQFKRFVQRPIMFYTALKDLYHVEWFVLRLMILAALHDLYSVEWFALRWMICITLNDLYNVEWFVQRWMIFPTR